MNTYHRSISHRALKPIRFFITVAATVFTLSVVSAAITPTQQAYLKAFNAESYDYFGYAVSVSGDTMVVGAYGEDGGATGVNGNPNLISPDTDTA